jgi:hypothetical protein
VRCLHDHDEDFSTKAFREAKLLGWIQCLMKHNQKLKVNHLSPKLCTQKPKLKDFLWMQKNENEDLKNAEDITRLALAKELVGNTCLHHVTEFFSLNHRTKLIFLRIIICL